MSLLYKPQMCNNCKRENGGTPSFWQRVLLAIGFVCMLVPGVLYFFLGKPKHCYICGLKRQHQD